MWEHKAEFIPVHHHVKYLTSIKGIAVEYAIQCTTKLCLSFSSKYFEILSLHEISA